MSKYRVISGPYFPVFGVNTGIYEPEITPYLDTLHPVPALNYVINKYLHTLPSSSVCFWLSSISTVSNVSFSFWFAVVESLSTLMTILSAFAANIIFTE